MYCPETLRDSSEKYRLLANAMSDDLARTELLKLARQYRELAAQAEVQQKAGRS